ncbi:MAG: DotU family type IV/VI secretion system protein [Desulfococcaceae bacterium]|jgi:type IV/VI secretion system ImpK/VasF family protein|nr:DotU family type IV/VI secretion system protein [Desulfococcaceae bacterium]
MKLYDIARDLFNYLTVFRWKVAARTHMTPEEVRHELLHLFQEQEMKIRRNPDLRSHYDLVKYPLTVFADEVILYSAWDYAADWENDLLEQRFFETEIGGDRFFDLCEDLDIRDPDVAAVYYTCLSMGFRGRYDADAEELRLLKQEFLEKCSPVAEDARAILLSPAAYTVKKTAKVRRLSRLLQWRHVFFLMILLIFLGIITDRVLLWEFISAPVRDVSVLADNVMVLGSSDPPVPLSLSPHPDFAEDNAPGDPYALPDWVQTEVLPAEAEKEEKNDSPPENMTPASSAAYTIQIAAFFSRDQADALVKKLRDKGYECYIADRPHSSGKTWYFVRMGHFAVGSIEIARKAAAAFEKKEGMDVFVTNQD